MKKVEIEAVKERIADLSEARPSCRLLEKTEIPSCDLAIGQKIEQLKEEGTKLDNDIIKYKNKKGLQ